MNLNELLNAYHYSRFRLQKVEDRNSAEAELWKVSLEVTTKLLDENFPDWYRCVMRNGLSPFTTGYVIIDMQLYSAELMEEVRKQCLHDLEKHYNYMEGNKPGSLVDMKDKPWREMISENLNRNLRKIMALRFQSIFRKK